MPKRTNLFQDVVEIIHRHMAGEATVEASAMLPSKATGKLREVDVVIKSNIAGYEVIVSVEAVGRSRRATREWVDQMLGKHGDLPTSRLVLVSERSFTTDARAAAIAAGAVPLSPEELTESDPAYRIVNNIPELWPKLVNFTAETFSIKFEDENDRGEWSNTQPTIHNASGVKTHDSLNDLFKELYNTNFPKIADLTGVANARTSTATRWNLRFALEEVYARKSATGKLCKLLWMSVSGPAQIEVSDAVQLTHKRLAGTDTLYAYGTGRIANKETLFVTTESDEGGMVTLRVRSNNDNRSKASDPD